jgi:hypothetical protein
MRTAERSRPAAETRGSTGNLLKRVLVGRQMSSSKLEHTLLPKILALPVFSSDPLSSVAYATEEILIVLVSVSLAAAHGLVMPIALAIAAVMTIVVVSYRQTVRAYPSGGGAYIVSKENLGPLPGLVAAAALLTDYVLTVSVSVAAGVFAISSALPELHDDRLWMSLAFVGLITLANLRGVKESGTLFAVPTYSFVAAIFVMLVTGTGSLCVLRMPPGALPRAPSGDRCRRPRGVHDPPGLLFRVDGAHRRGGHLQRRSGVPASPGQERRGDFGADGRAGHLDVPGDLLPGLADRGGSQPRAVRRLADRPDGLR